MLEEIIRLNNEGAALVLDNRQGNNSKTVILKHALQQFHTAIRSTLKLREYCDQQQPCSYPHSSHCATAAVMIDLTGLWYTASAATVAPPILKERQEETSRANSTGTDHAYYVYQQPFFLHQQAILRACSTTTDASSAGHVVRAVLQLIESVLLMNAALACYQLGQQHKQVANNGADSWGFNCFKIQQSNGVFFYSKALPLYVRAIHYLKGCYIDNNPRTANDKFCRYHESTSSRPVSSSSPLSLQLQGVQFVIMAALNNLSGICVELGLMEQAKGAQVELHHWQEAAALSVGETGAQSSSYTSTTTTYTREQMEVIEEFLLNSTVLFATGFFANLPACAA